MEIDEDGGLRLYMSRFSDRTSDQFADRPGDVPRLFPSAAVIYTRQLIALAAAAAEHAAISAPWLMAADATGIQGLTAHDNRFSGFAGPQYDAQDYRCATTAS